MRSSIVFLSLCSLSLLGACAMDTDPAGTQGFTVCGGGQCQPGQYCVDATFEDCQPGCTSDVNCAVEQSCVKPAGASVGDCVNDGPAPSQAACGNGACEAGEGAASCPADCGGSSPVCGDGVCEPGETMACADCATGDGGLNECLDHCGAYDFFECIDARELQACRDACRAADPVDRGDFNDCAARGAIDCDTGCLDLL